MEKGINERIKELRNKKKMTQEELGKALGMKCSTYSQMERKGKITVDMARRIAEILDVAPDIIMYGEKQIPFPEPPIITPPLTLGDPSKNNPFGVPAEPEVIVGYKYGEITLSVMEELIIKRFRDLSPEEQKKFTDFVSNLPNNL